MQLSIFSWDNMFHYSLSRYWWKLLIFSMIFILSGCFWTSNTTETNTTQDISFSSYVFTIPNSYSSGEVSNRVDSRIVKKIIAVYSSFQGDGFYDNIVISSDKLVPNASLEDYVQAGIGWMAYTRWQYKSIKFEKSTLNCSALSIPKITNTFSIYRIAPTTNSSETLYFVQTYLHRLSEVITISASTSNKDNVTTLQDMMNTISCNFSAKP